MTYTVSTKLWVKSRTQYLLVSFLIISLIFMYSYVTQFPDEKSKFRNIFVIFKFLGMYQLQDVTYFYFIILEIQDSDPREHPTMIKVGLLKFKN